MPWFYFITDDGLRIDADVDAMEFPSQAAAIEEAHRALRDMAREYAHDRSRPTLRVTVQDEQGVEIYWASMKFDEKST